VIFVLKSFYKVEKKEITKEMRKLLGFRGLKMKDKQTIERTFDLWEEHPDDIIDCYIVACMKKTEKMRFVALIRK